MVRTTRTSKAIFFLNLLLLLGALPLAFEDNTFFFLLYSFFLLRHNNV